jgi:hypothetical protein
MKNSLALLIPFSAVMLLTACNQSLNINELCERDVKFCADFYADSWCKRERKQMLLQNSELIDSKDDQDRYELLIALENYSECMGLASKIEHIKFKEKSTYRFKSLDSAKKHIQKLSNETANSSNPHLLHYHWSRYINKTSLNKFLALENSHQLETPELQFKLATYFIKTNIRKTLQLLFHALELYENGDDLNVEIFKSISTIFADKKQTKQAYVWFKILHLYKPKDPEVNEKSLSDYIMQHQLDETLLNKIAAKTLDQIESGSFVSPRH